jgi:hypothetical protein
MLFLMLVNKAIKRRTGKKQSTIGHSHPPYVSARSSEQQSCFVTSTLLWLALYFCDTVALIPRIETKK